MNTNPEQQTGQDPQPSAGDGPDGVCWEYQAGELPIRLSFTIYVF